LERALWLNPKLERARQNLQAVEQMLRNRQQASQAK
jgi:hypothetical protein